MIVDDENDWITVIKNMLKPYPDIVVAGIAENEKEIYKILNETEIDIIIMDINLTSNNKDGIYIAAEVSKNFDVKVLMLSGLNPQEVAVDSFNAGAVSFVSKENYADIPHEIRKAYYGNPAMNELLSDFRLLKKDKLLSTLTSSEIELFELLEQGYKKSDIQKMIFKTESTLKNQINSILKKLNVKNTKEAVEKVNMRGLYKPKSIDSNE